MCLHLFSYYTFNDFRTEAKTWHRYTEIFHSIYYFLTLLSPSDKVRNLQVIFDSSFGFLFQVSSICSSSYCHICDLARIRCYLDKSTAIAVANALVCSRLDYCNSLLNTISKYNLKQLNSIQYSLCRIVQRCSGEHRSPHLRSLHWLPVKQRIKFKWCLLIFKNLKLGLPPYFSP